MKNAKSNSTSAVVQSRFRADELAMLDKLAGNKSMTRSEYLRYLVAAEYGRTTSGRRPMADHFRADHRGGRPARVQAKFVLHFLPSPLSNAQNQLGQLTLGPAVS